MSPGKGARCAREATHLDHGQKHAQLIERGRTGLGRHIDFLER
jgi:hypothetical protein